MPNNIGEGGRDGREGGEGEKEGNTIFLSVLDATKKQKWKKRKEKEE